MHADLDDLKNFISNFNEAGHNNFKTSGCKIQGVKFLYLSSTEAVARFRKGTSGVHAIKTLQAFIICVYGEPAKTEGSEAQESYAPPQQAAGVVEKLGDYLIKLGY